jgi:integrating conjugative element protein (TIGR03755 family)
MKKRTLGISIGLVIAMTNSIFADIDTENFPSNSTNSSLYYQMGGGRSVPIPPVDNNVSIPIGAEGDVGLGFSCGMFSPQTTITNSLNDYKDSVQNVQSSVVYNATSAIISFPMYKLAQADPKLYNILNNNVVGAHNQYSMKMKSCEEMQSEALKGKDAYNKYITISRNNSMKKSMTFGDGDLNKAMHKANQLQGDEGVAWSTPGGKLGASAGGKGQAPIHVIYDTTVAGYNVLLGRDPTDTNAPQQSTHEQQLLNYWKDPNDAAKWVVSVVGDQKITTCKGSECDKASTPGTGLLPFVQTAATDIEKKLSDLVTHPGEITGKVLRDKLLAVSAPGQVVSESLINSISNMNQNAKENTIATLSQNIATSRIVNEALISINMLQIGSEVPNIHAVGPAQTVILGKIRLLQSEINHIMYSVNIRHELNSNVMSSIMDYNNIQNKKAESIPRLDNKPAIVENGGIVKQDQN